MADRPIIFSPPMVRALLDGRKTQTRRVLKPQPPEGALCYWAHLPGYECWMYQGRPEPMPGNSAYIPQGRLRVPYAPGDRLWVREAHALVPSSAYRCSPGVPYAVNDEDPYQACVYRDGWERSQPGTGWRPSIHMPRWASRLTLIVTDVRVQRLQEISEADAVAEGCEASGWRPTYSDPDNAGFAETKFATDEFADLWSSLHGPESLDANPWVAALTFTVQHGNIDQIGGAQ